jgi:hypothetical protein
MKNQGTFVLDSNTSLPLEEEVQGFHCEISASVEENRKREQNSQSTGEYLTVKYRYSSWKSYNLLLQTVLNLVMRKEELFLSLGEYFVIEDLVSRIEELGFRGNSSEKKLAIEQMLSFALLILRVVPLKN